MTKSKNNVTRWGILTTIGILVILLVATALFAQGSPQRGGMQGGPGGGHGGGFGGQQGMMGGGPGGGHGGPGQMLGAQFLMQDPEIVELMGIIRVVEGINRLDLTVDQVRDLRDLAVEAQELTEANLGNTRDEVRDILADQLDSVLAGADFDESALRDLMGEFRENNDTDSMREQMTDILDRAREILTEEQLDSMCRDRGDGAGQGFQNQRGNQNQGGYGNQRGNQNQGSFGGQRGNQNQNGFGGQRDGQFGERVEQGVVGMKLMMILNSPMAVDGMDIWLMANG